MAAEVVVAVEQVYLVVHLHQVLVPLLVISSAASLLDNQQEVAHSLAKEVVTHNHKAETRCLVANKVLHQAAQRIRP